ncbi:SGNH hydrolase-type esterase domain-containing protein [Aspergillus crustosus]
MIRSLTACLALLAAAANALPQQSAAKAVTKRAGSRVIKEWTSLGDSYGAGIRSGKPYYLDTNLECSRGSESYVAYANANGDFPGATDRKFNFGACLGSTAQDVIDNSLAQEVPEDSKWVPFGHPDTVAVSLGGNVIGLADVSVACIYRFFAGLDTEGFDFCPDTLNTMKGHLDNNEVKSEVARGLQAIWDTAKAAGGADDLQIYWVGYPRFFNTDNKDCDHVYWNWWRYTDPVRAWLTQDLRGKINDLITLLSDGTLSRVNEQTEAAIKEFSGHDSVFFVDIDSTFEGHRFCEPGTDLWSPLGDETWLFHVNSGNTDGESFQGGGNITSEDRDGINNAISQAIDPNNQGISGFPETNDRPSAEVFFSQLPDNYKKLSKIFHPKPTGHWAIMEKLISSMKEHGNMVPEEARETKLHIGNGCIAVEGLDDFLCAGSDTTYRVGNQGGDNKSVTIIARFPGDSSNMDVIPDCKITVSWPKDFGDVYWGEGDCLRDSEGSVIWGQCCSDNTKNTENYHNPYYKG